MKSNIARRIDDTDDPRLPHPMFPRSDGQPESRRIFYIRLFRKRTPDGPIEFCPLRFLASESREEGWTHFVKRFGGGYYRAEATSSANKKQAYTGGSSLRWFHFAGPSKPFPLPGSTVQAAPEPNSTAMPSATWNELRALLKSERRAFAEQLEAERKAGDERMRAWMEHAEKMAQAESARVLALERMLLDEREHGKQLEARLIEALKERHHLARVREVEARQAATRISETMRIHAENEAMRIAGYLARYRTKLGSMAEKFCVRDMEDMSEARSEHGPDAADAVRPMLIADGAETSTNEAVASTSAKTACDAEQPKPQAKREQPAPAQEAPSIRVQRTPPPHDPEGMITIRTLHGWLTIPCEWLRQDITDDVRAMLSNLLSSPSP